MKNIILIAFLLSVAQAQIYVSPFEMGKYGGELSIVNSSGDTIYNQSVSASRAQSHRIQGRFQTWMTVNPNGAFWRDTITGKVDSFIDPYIDSHGFVISDSGFIFIINEPNWIDSIRHFRIEWRDVNGLSVGAWHSEDNLNANETDSSIVFDEGNGLWNAWHPNWITEKGLLSCRHTNTVYLISKDNTTRRRIKGGFRGQHSPHFIGKNRILLYDNLGSTTSRILVVDTFGLTVEKISPTNRKGSFMGNVQKIHNGYLVCWGGEIGGLGHPEIELYSPFGDVVWAIDLPGNLWTYQAWIGVSVILNNTTVLNPTPKVITRSFDLLGRNLSP